MFAKHIQRQSLLWKANARTSLMTRLSSSYCAAGNHSRDFHESNRCCALSRQLHRAIATSIVNQTNTFSPFIPTHVPAALLPSMVTSPLLQGPASPEQQSQTKSGQVTT